MSHVCVTNLGVNKMLLYGLWPLGKACVSRFVTSVGVKRMLFTGVGSLGKTRDANLGVSTMLLTQQKSR